MISTDQTLEDLTLTINQEIHVQAPLDVTFAALLEQLGPGNETPDGKSLNMKIEPWPGGRWYRDLGDGNGHFWANVQAIKRPTLLEFAGPLFASFPFVSNVQYRLSEADGGTLDHFPAHRARIRFRGSQGRDEQRLGRDARTRAQASRGTLTRLMNRRRGEADVSTMHNHRNADCRQRHLYRWPGGNRNQKIRREAFRRSSLHSKPIQGCTWCSLWRTLYFSNERHGSKDSRSLTGARIDGKPAIDQIYPFLHTHQA